MNNDLDTEQIMLNRFALVAAVREWMAMPAEVRVELVEELMEEDETGDTAFDDFVAILSGVGLVVATEGYEPEPASRVVEYEALTGAYL